MNRTESTADYLEKMARDLEYPPLNGGPTKDQIIEALRGAAYVIGELETDGDRQDEQQDKIEELEGAIEDACESLDDLDVSLTLAKASGEIPESLILEKIEWAISATRSNLRRI